MSAKTKLTKSLKPKRQRPPTYQGATLLRDISRAVDEAMKRAEREERAA